MVTLGVTLIFVGFAAIVLGAILEAKDGVRGATLVGFLACMVLAFLGVGSAYLGRNNAKASITKPAEAAVTEQKSVTDQFGKNSVSVDCADSRAEDGGPSPCALIRVVNPNVTRKNTRFTARLVSDTELKILVCTMTDTSGERSPFTCGSQLGDHTAEWSYHYATDQNGRGVDLYRISEVRFVRAGWAVTMDWVRVQQ